MKTIDIIGGKQVSLSQPLSMQEERRDNPDNIREKYQTSSTLNNGLSKAFGTQHTGDITRHIRPSMWEGAIQSRNIINWDMCHSWLCGIGGDLLAAIKTILPKPIHVIYIPTYLVFFSVNHQTHTLGLR